MRMSHVEACSPVALRNECPLHDFNYNGLKLIGTQLDIKRKSSITHRTPAEQIAAQIGKVNALDLNFVLNDLDSPCTLKSC